MRVTKLLMAVFAILLFVSGCAPFRGSLKAGESLPEGKVLLIGAVALDPPVEQGKFVNIDVMGASQGVMRVALTKDLSKKVDLQAMTPISADDVLLMDLKGLSYIPLEPGTHYIRLGILDISSRGSVLTMPAGPGGSAGFKGIDVSALYLVKDLKIEIPEKAKAVYIGTIVFRHDGREATGVKVRDDFKQAAKDLMTKNIAGIASKDVVKKLAQVMK